MRRTVPVVLVFLLSCEMAAAQPQKNQDLIDNAQPSNFRLEGDQDAICFDIPTSIPPIGETSTTLDIPCPESTIEDLELLVQIHHTWVGDLSATLTKVGSGSATVFDRPGAPGQSTFGCSGDDIDAIINDEAMVPIEEECADAIPTIQGEFIGGDPPDNTLMARWDGEEICGTWTLTVADAAGGDSGFIEQWCLIPGPFEEPEDGGGDGGVSSTTGVGAIVTILLLLGTSTYFLCRRAID
jgi:hypothetical protein